MSLEFHYVVVRDSETGTWFTTDMMAGMDGNTYNTDTEEWVYGGDVAPDFDNESFTALSAALDELNKRNATFIKVVD